MAVDLCKRWRDLRRCSQQLACVLSLTLAGVGHLHADPFEPDDTAPYLGAAMDGAQPDFQGPANPALREGNEPIWLIRDRTLSGRD